MGGAKDKRERHHESGAVHKDWKGRIRVALVYPNTYHVGMSNLGYQSVYGLLNDTDDIVCERAFVPENASPAEPRTVESNRRLKDFDIVAFSVSYEIDYLNIVRVLDASGIPPSSADRNDDHPLIIAGGVACFLNPEPIAPFFDCILIGEAEPIVSALVPVLTEWLKADRRTLLLELIRRVPGTYVPRFYRSVYRDDGTIDRLEPMESIAPPTIERALTADLSAVETCSRILASDTAFDAAFLVEVSRGCPHGCRFCSAGFVYRPPRFRNPADIHLSVSRGLERTGKIGLVGAAVSDLPEIESLCRRMIEKAAAVSGEESHSSPQPISLSFSSLRADSISGSFASVLRAAGVKTATVAPDAGSQRMRNVINKGIEESDILQAAETLVASGIPNLKLYFMVGLPFETEDDVSAIVELCKKIKHRFLKASRTQKRIGDITVGIGSFVPKPFTPFQWAAMDSVPELKKKLKKIKTALKKIPNVRVHSDLPQWAYIQNLIGRGDRKVGEMLLAAHRNQGNWPQTLKSSPVNPDFYVLRQRQPLEKFPWDFIDHGIDKKYLWREYEKARLGETTPPCPAEPCIRCGVCHS